MSLATWKNEFYPVAARGVPAAEAVAHSLRKWRGLTRENLEKHGVVQDGKLIKDDNIRLSIDADSCALCELYIGTRTRDYAGPAYCPKCPLSIARGDVACDAERRDDGGYDDDDDDDAYAGPYGNWPMTGDAAPMIAALEAAAVYEKSPIVAANPAVALTDKLAWLGQTLSGPDGPDPAYEDAAGHLCDLLELCRKNIHPSVGEPFADLAAMVAHYGKRPEEIDVNA